MIKVKIASVFIFVFLQIPFSKAQKPFSPSFFYVGLNVKILTLLTKTNYTTLFSLNMGYNNSVNHLMALGVQFETLFARNPKDRGARPSFYLGPVAKIETSELYTDYNDASDFPKNALSNTFMALFPLKPEMLLYNYGALYRFSTTVRSEEVLFYRIPMSFNVEFQNYNGGILGSEKGNLTLGMGVSPVIKSF
ncbi:hypothetical protein [Pseudopedobacter sp.]|uniref:hypothetical protein n=1 Tax=Pseudopedobacter sp. TaxID=1936787 RepID=UPI0033428ECB